MTTTQDLIAQLRDTPKATATLLSRATDLHEKAQMSWKEAEALALSEAGVTLSTIDELIGNSAYRGVDSLLTTPDEIRDFTRAILVHSSNIDALYATPQAAAQPPAPSDTAITYMAGYSDGREWAGATNQAQPSQARVVELVAAANKDAVLQASIDFIRELTGMEPPPIEVAPPETFQPFKTFADKVCAIFATPQAAAQPEPYGYHSPKTGKVYASTEAASMAMAGEVKTVYLATQAQPSQAVELSDDEIVQVFADCHRGRIYPQDNKCGPRAMRITEGRAIIAAINAKAAAPSTKEKAE